LRVRSLRNDDGDGNENGKKEIGLDKQNKLLVVNFWQNLSIIPKLPVFLSPFMPLKARFQRTTKASNAEIQIKM